MPYPSSRAQRALEAAESKVVAGAPEGASTLLAKAAAGSLDEVRRARVQRLHGQISLDLRRAADALPMLLDAAKQLEPLDVPLVRDAYLEALRAANVAGRLGPGTLDAARAALAAPHAPGEPRAVGIRWSTGWPFDSPKVTPPARPR